MEPCNRQECSNVLKPGQIRFSSHRCSAIVTNTEVPRRKKKFHGKCFRDGCANELDRGNKKFCSNRCQLEYQQQQRLKLWLTQGNPGCISKPGPWLRNYLLEDQDFKCAICGINNSWMSRSLTFILDHIDGDALN